MKASYHAGRGLLRLLILLAFLVAGNSQVARAAEPEQDGISREDIDAALRAERAKLNARDALSIVGTWENSDRNMAMTFSEGGEFQFTREKNGQTTGEKGLYKVTSSGDSLLVSVFFSQGKDYFSVTSLSENRAAWQELKSPEEKPDPDKAVIWTRSQAGPVQAESSRPAENAKGEELFALQKPENLIGQWKSAAATDAITMSFSEKGEFEQVMEKGGKRNVVQAKYTAEVRNGRLVVTLTDGGDEKLYYGFALTAKDRIIAQRLKSPDDAIDPDKRATILSRVP